MFDHITIDVADLDIARRFYDDALRPLGIERLYADGTSFFGYGCGEKAFFWIGRRGATPTRAHIAFAAPDRATVDRFFAAALAAGGRDNGSPGIYPEYHAYYYGGFVLDPDGNNIEAVCHTPPHNGTSM
jgi:catechol 2,3-dioxygenase-like lactoylglutathione lyase family enzyme